MPAQLPVLAEAATLCAKRGPALEMGISAEYDTIKPLPYPAWLPFDPPSDVDGVLD
ncbi:MAG TPA: hypothetical protein VLQ68_07635 [Rhizobiaceae bacterium]|nr:hypothetical protein [Rhizobiaceae bacterium]